MKVLIEISDEDTHIVEKYVQIEMPILVQTWVMSFVEYMKGIALASNAGIELTVDEVLKMQKEKIANSFSLAKKIATKRKM
jgi:hypothetical protein